VCVQHTQPERFGRYMRPSAWLPPDHVHVWRATLPVSEDELARLEPMLGLDDRQRAARFHFARDQQRFSVSHAYLRMILSRYTAVQPAELTFDVGAYGKPNLVGHALSFNMAHSADLAVFAIAEGSALGVDVEAVNPEVDLLGVGRRVFPKAEAVALEHLAPRARLERFFEVWTQLEACMKAAGTGLSMDSRTIDLALSRLSARTPAVGDVPAAVWALHRLDLGPGYAAALATRSQHATVQCFSANAL